MSCDICGEEIRGRPLKVIIEGAVVVTCPQCGRLGKPYIEPPRPRLSPPVHVARSTARPGARATRPISREALGELEVTENYAARIRRAREKIGLTQEDLATRVKEKLSIIQKIESGKMTPDMKLCRELEHFLKIELLVPSVEAPVTTPPLQSANLTLGDIIKVKRRDEKELT